MSTTPFTQALQEEVAQLQAHHPILAGGLDKAFTLVASGAVFPLEDGRTAHVRSQSDPTVSHLVNGTCDCKATQYYAAPCAHRLAWRLYQRVAGALLEAEERWEPTQRPQDATTAVRETPDTSGVPDTPAGLPEAPVSITLKASLHGYEALVTLRGTDFASVQAQVEQAAEWLTRQAQPQASSTGEGKAWCRLHNVKLHVNHGKDGRTWLSHRTPEGQWCKGTGREARAGHREEG